MAYVNVPKDLTKVKTKVALNLTKRQIICFSLAAAAGIPTYLLTRGAIGNDAAVLIMIGLMLPFFFLAMYEKDGQSAEKILRNIVRARLWPGTRAYKTENLYNYLQKKEGPSIANQNQATKQAGAKAVVSRPAGKKR